MVESSKTENKEETFFEFGADSFDRFRNYQAQYNLRLVLDTLSDQSDYLNVYCELQDDIVIERVDATAIAIQVASQQPGDNLTSGSDKFLKSLKNFAVLSVHNTFNIVSFGIVSSAGFSSRGSAPSNVWALRDECVKKITSNEPLTEAVQKWIQKELARLKSEPLLNNFSENDLINLISKLELEDGAPLHTVEVFVKDRLRGIPEVDALRLSESELNELRSKLLSHICDAACLTRDRLKQEFSDFRSDAVEKREKELFERKRFDKGRISGLINDELNKIRAVRLTLQSDPLQDSQSKPFQAELQHISGKAYQVRRALVEFSSLDLNAVIPATGTILIETSSETSQAASPAISKEEADYNPIIDKIKEEIDQFRLDEALSLLSKWEALILEKGNERHKFRFHTNFAAALELKGENEAAARHLFSAITFASEDVKANCNASYAAIISNDLSEAERYAQKAIDLDPKQSAGYAALIASTRSRKSLEELVEGVPPEHRRASDVAYALGCYAKELERLEEAHHWFEIAAEEEKPNSIRLKMQLGEILLRISTKSREEAALGAINAEQKKMIARALGMFDEVWKAVGTTPAAPQYPIALINLAYAARILRDKDKLGDCLKYISDYLERYASTEQLLKTKGLVEVDTGKLPDALKTLEKITNPTDPEIFYLILELSNQLGINRSYRTAFRGLIRGDDKIARIEAWRIRAVHALESGRLKSARRLIRAFDSETPEKLLVYLLRSRLHRCENHLQEAQVALANAKKLIDNKTSIRDRLEYASEAYLFGRPQESVEVLRPIVNTKSDNLVTKKYVEYLYRSGELPKAREMCLELLVNSRDLVFFHSMLATIAEEVNDLESAKRHFETCAKEAGAEKGLRYQIRRCHIDFRLGDYTAVDNFLSSRIDTSELDFLETSLLSRLYVARGQYYNAIKTVYDCRRRMSGIELDRLYAATFFNTPKDNAEWLNVERVVTDSAVLIQSESQKPTWFILEADERKIQSESELHVSNVFAQKLLGRKKGDSIEVTKSSYNGRVEIGEVLSKYVYAYQLCLPTVAVRTIDTSDTKKLIAELEKDAGERRDFGLKLEKAYTECHVSLERLTEVTGIDLYDGWESFTQIPDRKILCSIGNDEEIASALSRLDSPRKIVFDYVALLTLQAMPTVAEKLLQCGTEVIVAQSVLDDIDNQIFVRSGHKAGGYSIFSSGESGNSFLEISKEKIKADHDKLVQLRDWIRRHTKIKPCDEYKRLTRAKRQRLEGILGEASAETVLLAENEGAILCSDDLFVRTYAEQKEKVQTTWTEALLLKANQKGVIGADELISGRLTLSSRNYYYVHIGHDVLLKAAEVDDWDAGLSFQAAARLLDDPTTLDSAFHVVWAFLLNIFSNHMDWNKQMRICECLLDKTTKSRDKLEFLQALLRMTLKLPIQMFGRKISIRQFLERWAISRGVVKPWEKFPE